METARIKNLFFLLMVVFMALPFSAHASGYVVNLYFDPIHKTLSFDKTSGAPVTLDKDTQPDYVSFSEDKTNGKYDLKLYDASHTDIVDTQFNHQDGAFSLKIPYFSLAYSMKIFDAASGKEILNADLSNFSACNGNGTCEFEKGENLNTCVSDCANSHVNYSEQAEKLLNDNNGVLKDPQTGQVLLKKLSPSYENQSPSNSPISFGRPSDSQDDSNGPQANPQTNQSLNAMNIFIISLISIAFISIVVIVIKKFFRRNNNS